MCRRIISLALALGLGAGCSERVVDVDVTMAACAESEETCVAAMLADAAYVGPDDPSVVDALGLLLDTSPEWYGHTVSSWRVLDGDPKYGVAVASARGRRVVLHAPWSWPAEVVVAGLVHESAHTERPWGARHVRCEWEGGCDDGEDGDGYVRVADFVAESGWSGEVSDAIFAEAVARSGL